MEALNWISDHWLLVIVLALIASATYAIPKIVAALAAANSVDRFGR